MPWRDLRVGWRLLAREPAWSLIVIVGLAVGFAACFLLIGFVRFSWSYDASVPDHQRIYLVKARYHLPGIRDQWMPQAPLALRDIAARLPAVSALSMFGQLDASMKVGQTILQVPVTLVDPAFAAMFSVKTYAGDLSATLDRPDRLALTVESAERLFGANNVVGRIVTIRGVSYTVGAVVVTPAATSTVRYDALAGTASTVWDPDDRAEARTSWGRVFGRLYLKLTPGANPSAITSVLQDASNQSPLHRQLAPELLSQLGGRNLMDVALVSLGDVYLDPDLAETADPREHGSRGALWALATTGVLILLLACVNYINLATTRTLRRQREIGVRKVLGASVARIAAQFMGESVLTALVATGCGLLLAWLVLPVFAALMNRPLTGLFTPLSCASALILGVVLGVVTGAYPSWVAGRVLPTAALSGRGNAETAAGFWVRRALTVTQFTIAMGLIGVAVAIAWQTWHAAGLNPGFDANSILVIDMAPPFTPSGPRTRAFATAVAHLPGVAGAAQSMEAIGRSVVVQKSTAKREGGFVATLERKGVGTGYFDVYEIPALAGRVFTLQRDGDLTTQDIPNNLVLSATAARALGFEEPAAAIGRSVELDGKEGAWSIIGVVPDIRHQSLREPPLPVAYTLSRSTPVLSVRVNGDVPEVRQRIEALWPSFFPDTTLQMSRATTFLQARYADDLRAARLLAAATVIAITLAVFGTYVLSAYVMRRLFLQITIRKLHGARSYAIAYLVTRELAVLLLVGAVIALPVAYVVTEAYLAGIVERASFGVWPLLFALVGCALVTMAAASRHVFAAMRLKPAVALRV